MKAPALLTPALLVSAVVWIGASVAVAQPPGWRPYGYDYGYWDSGASTVGESYARGMSDVVRSQGQANLLNSRAAINWDEARRRSFETQKQYTEAYFAMREMNREYRAKERGDRPISQDFIRYAQMGKPERLSASQLDPVTGELKWPMLLTTADFADGRLALQQAFADRAAKGTLGLEEFRVVKETTEQMITQLQQKVRELPPQQYVEAKNFLESIRYEAGLPPA
jgi:hypothetical protein